MKPFLAALISTLIVGQALAFYVPTIAEAPLESCGCSGKFQNFFEDSQVEAKNQYPERLPVDDARYRFNFAVQEPKPDKTQTELKSHEYDVDVPVTENTKPEPKYHFDYSIQAPAEEKPVEQPERPLYGRVDKVVEDKQECTCSGDCTCSGNPCTCQFGNCPIHGRAFTLPIRYDTESDYVEYDYPERYRRSLLGSLRSHRQADAPKLIDLDKLKDLHSKIDLSKIHESFKKTSDNMKERLSTFGSSLDPLVSHASSIMSNSGKFLEGFKKNFGGEIRERREVRVDREQRENDRRIPVLRVKEKQMPCQTIESLKRLSESRVELQSPDSIQFMPELASKSDESEKHTECRACGSRLDDSVCKSCGAHQPQYVEFIQGKPVSFYPGAVQEQPREDESPRYIYDRYGHKYLENNGNLRLIAPDYRQEAVVGSQPDFAGLADILSQNKEVMRQLNPLSGTDRLLPQPVDLAEDAIHYIHEIARRETEDNKTNEDEKRSDATESEKQNEKREKPVKNLEKREQNERKQKPKSMYQVLPMKYDGKDGKVVVKVYSAKDSAWKKNENRSEASHKHHEELVNTAQRPKPIVHKFKKNQKEFEVLSFDTYSNNSEEEIREIIKHVHGNRRN